MLRLKELYSGAPLDIACHIVTMVLVAALYWSLLDHRLLLTWLTINTLILAHRALLVREFRSTSNTETQALWLQKYETSALCSGIAWGFIYSYSAITLPAQHLPAFTLILGALVAVPLATYFSQWSVYVRFSTPAMLIPIIVLLATAEPLKAVLALLTLGWYVVTNQNGYQLTEQREKLAAYRHDNHQNILAEIDKLTALNEEKRLEIQRIKQCISALQGVDIIATADVLPGSEPKPGPGA